MANINDGDFIPLIGSNGSANGFQDAHINASKFSEKFKNDWFRKLFGANGADDLANIFPLPETTQGGATMGVAVHNGRHVDAFDELLYDENVLTNSNSTKYFNIIERQLEARLQARGLQLKDVDLPAASDIAFEFKIKVRNGLDFIKCQFMDQPFLDKLGIPGLKTLAFNGSDYRFGGAGNVTSYLNQLSADGFFDFDAVVNNQLFKDIKGFRGGLDINVDADIIGKYSEFSRLLFPNGEDLRTVEIKADMLTRRYGAHKFTAADGTFDKLGFEQLVKSEAFVNMRARVAADLRLLTAEELAAVRDLPSLIRAVMRTRPENLIADGRAFSKFLEVVYPNASDNPAALGIRKQLDLTRFIEENAGPDVVPEGRVGLGKFAGSGLFAAAMTWTAYTIRNAKALAWATGGDPLVLDLGGRGLETTSLDVSSVHFDLNTNFFSERTGFLGSLAANDNDFGTLHFRGAA